MFAPRVTWLLATPFNVVIVGPPAVVEAEMSNVAAALAKFTWLELAMLPLAPDSASVPPLIVVTPV